MLTAIAIGYGLLVNLVAFALMGIDKNRARRNAWRIPEKQLFFWAVIGGSIGAIAGMQFFRHKTRHWYFKVFMPCLAVIDIVALALLCVYVA